MAKQHGIGAHLKVKVGGLCFDWREQIEQVGVVDWPFQFWDMEDYCKTMKTKLEQLEIV